MNSTDPRARRITLAAVTALGLVAALTPAAQASDGAASLYLLGSGGPQAAVMPPVQGVFYANTAYVYSGESGGGRQFAIGGSVVADIDATVVADFASVLWVPTTDLLGGVLGVGAVVPVGHPSVDVSAVITGPRGGQGSLERSDAAWVVADPVAMAMLGWKAGKWHLQAAGLLNFPIGAYREDQLANLAFHRWALDTSLAATWHDDEAGWDLSTKAGFTFNGKNDYTDYDTGTEFHVEGSVERTFSKAFSAGVQGYYFEQVTGDSGAGARLGPFKGRVAGLGAHGAYHFAIGRKPATLRLHAAKEFAARNRLEGTAVWLDFSVPLSMKLPAAARR